MQLARQIIRSRPLGAVAAGVLCFALWAGGPVYGQVSGGDIAVVAMPAPMPHGAQGSVTVTIPVGAHTVTVKDQFHAFTADGFGRYLVPGMPNLPSRIVAVAIPPGAEVVGVRYAANGARVLDGAFRVPPVPLPGVIGEENAAVTAWQQQVYDANYAAVYGSDAVYPASPVEFVRKAGYRRYNLVDLRITPFAYRPQSRQVTRYEDITVYVDYRMEDDVPGALNDSSPRAERLARRLVANHSQAQDWYPELDLRADERDRHDFVIITLDALTEAVEPLANWESLKGRTVEVVTTSWIDSSYDGYDLAAKIRAFLHENYTTFAWGIEDVLLVGHYDDVPMRRCAQDMGYGRPETDFYYAELSEPDDESWDADGDHQYGESSDPIDMYAEINVGRIPWSDPDIVRHICEKSIAYERSEDDSFKKNILLLGAYYWADTDNAVLMEAKADQEWMADWTMVRMYEQNYSYHSSYECDYPLEHDNVMDVLPTGRFAFVNYAGHGSPTSCHILGMGAAAFISSSDCPQLDDEYPAIMFAAACSNSDTEYLNIGQAMMAQGAVGFLGSTKVAYGWHAWSDPYDGTTQSMDYFFTTAVTSGNYTQGEAHQFALAEMYSHGLWYYPMFETFEWGALWGDPNLGMVPPLFLGINFPDGVPEYLPPGRDMAFRVEIVNGTEEYVPGTGRLHYRYDGGEWIVADLVELGGNLYEALLPATACGMTPEFFISAEGSVSGEMTRPFGAPGEEVYTAEVATVTRAIDDDFEMPNGWMTVHEDLRDGAWQRGVPAGDGSRGDPTYDYDGSGQCFLTANRAGNSDVDGGPTRLVSPALDLSVVAEPVLSYARWFYNDDLDADRLDIEISNDDGATWTLIESVGSGDGAPQWVHQSYRVADLVPLTDQVRLRFSVSDNPNNSITEAAIDSVQVIDICCVTPGSGDIDSDGDMDLDDYAVFPACMTGPANGPVAPRCEAFNFDADDDVDIDDFGEFQNAFVG